MSQPPNQISAEQRRGYRRGIVLGLTLAEVALLLVFVLLMLLATGFAKRDRIIGSFKGKVAISINELRSLRESNGVLQQVRTALGVPEEVKSDDFISLVRNAKEAVDQLGQEPKSTLIEAMEQRKRVEEKLERIRQQLASDPNASKAIAGLVSQSENQQGQIVQLQKQLAAAGAGRVLPSCWTTKDGSIDYIFDVALTSEGLRVKERNPAGRAEERKRLPISTQNPAVVVQPGVFLSNTQRLFQQSIDNNCRFYVVVYDMTAPDEKALYKRLLDTVEDHFYKLSSNLSPPFGVVAP